jgi:hypothetical protein
MSLFNSQTIFSLFITLLIGFALYYYIKYKYRVLELTQREQAKVLQSVIMVMNNNNQNIMNIVQNRSQEEVVSDAVNEDSNRFRQVNSNNELIDVSDDSGSESSDDSDASSESSDSECDSDGESDQGEEQHEEQEVCDNTTRKILFTGNNDPHVVEHLDGPDIKVIELTHPLYTKNGGEEYRDDDGDDVDEDEDEDEDEDSDSESISSDFDGPHEPSVKHEKDDIHEVHEIHEIHEIKENVVISEINNNQIDLETDNSLDNISVKAVFKTKETKDSETHSDYNSMNVQSLRQLLRNKLSSEGSLMSEASINKLTKRDLIKHLS